MAAPQIGGSLVQNGKDTDGSGYAFARNVSPPVTLATAELQVDLINGAQANVITGTIGSRPTADLNFFDIAAVTLTTGTAADTVDVLSDGLTAYGLVDFTVQTGDGSKAD